MSNNNTKYSKKLSELKSFSINGKKINKLKYKIILRKNKFPYKVIPLNSIYGFPIFEKISTLLMKEGMKKRTNNALFKSFYAIKKVLLLENMVVWEFEINRTSRWGV